MKKPQPLFALGFTLIEVLVALAIFAILALASFVALHALIKNQAQLSQQNSQWQQRLIAVTLLRRDVTQMQERSVLDTSGGRVPAIVLRGTDDIEFTTAVGRNPLDTRPISALMRVRYQRQGEKLIRLVWPVLDRAPNTLPVAHVISEDLRSLRMEYVNHKGEILQTWSNESAQNEGLPRAIIWHLQWRHAGQLDLVLPIMGYAHED
jgi:general secretion pathway protein J